jgi:hypothetical protein
MSNIIVAKIHNNTLGKCISVETLEDGKELIKSWAGEQFQRPLTQDELDSLEEVLEVYNDEDSDNHYTFTIGILEQ